MWLIKAKPRKKNSNFKTEQTKNFKTEDIASRRLTNTLPVPHTNKKVKADWQDRKPTGRKEEKEEDD